MAKKKKQRAQYVSKGEVGNRMKTRTSTGMKRLLNQLDAWKKGKRVVLTVPNRDDKETNRRSYKVPARDHWGLPPAERRKELANEG